MRALPRAVYALRLGFGDDEALRALVMKMASRARETVEAKIEEIIREAGLPGPPRSSRRESAVESANV